MPRLQPSPITPKQLFIGAGVVLGVLLLSSKTPGTPGAGAPGQVPAVKTTLTRAQARAALEKALQLKLGRWPTASELAMLAAQSALETGNWQKMWNYNWGNITTTGSPWFTLGAEKLVGAHHYRPFNSVAEGATYYVDFLARRYPAAWALLGSGNTQAFSQALKAGGYYEGDPKKTEEQKVASYAAGLDSRYALS